MLEIEIEWWKKNSKQKDLVRKNIVSFKICGTNGFGKKEDMLEQMDW